MVVKFKDYYFKLHPRKNAPVKHCSANNIWQAYDNPSDRKVAAWHNCENMCRELDGWGICITGITCDHFSVMFDLAHPETGELMRAHITWRYNHLYYL